MKRILVFAALTVSALAVAEPTVGTLTTPGLRRSVQLVYVEKFDGTVTPPADPAAMNQKGNTYLPHILPVVLGTKVKFLSEDPELHNVFARQGVKVLFNQGQPPKAMFEKPFTQLGMVKLTCNIHKEMTAWVVVLQNPYWAFPNPQTGAFEIKGLPPGKYTLRVWGEKLDEELLSKKFAITVGGTHEPIQIAAR